jgi:two-component system sensor histidine kinase FlrB
VRAEIVPIAGDAAAGPGELGRLRRAFAAFAAATTRREREHAELRERVGRLTAELAEKDRLLAAGAEREHRFDTEALRQSRLAAMGEMAAMLAHEVRNPLGAMELFTGLLLQDLHDRPEAQTVARHIACGISDLNRLVTNLLEFTRVRPPRARAVDCSALIEDTLRYAMDLTAGDETTIVRRYSRPALHVFADPDLLRAVVLNLVRNAFQAMPGGGTLTVTVEAVGDDVWIAVGDSGPGVPVGLREEVFRPFFTTRAHGSGLGLTVARELVGGMGGTLVLAHGDGPGATFAIRLPAVPENAA